MVHANGEKVKFVLHFRNGSVVARGLVTNGPVR